MYRTLIYLQGSYLAGERCNLRIRSLLRNYRLDSLPFDAEQTGDLAGINGIPNLNSAVTVFECIFVLFNCWSEISVSSFFYSSEIWLTQ
jgi:hypothetical protein